MNPDTTNAALAARYDAIARHHGLPEIIRCDLGSPFASLGLGRLSSLSLWWIEQGIEVEFTRPGSPQACRAVSA